MSTPRTRPRPQTGRRARAGRRTGGGRRLVPWLALAALVLLGVAPYARALDYRVLHDDRTLLDNRWLARDAGPRTVFGHDYWYGTRHAGSDLYRPLTVLTLAWNLRGLPGATGLRAVNLTLHVGVVLLVFWSLRRLLSWPERGTPAEPATPGTGRPGLLPPAGPSRATVAAWIGAALFAAHPLASEAVLLIVGRAEMLAAAFGLAAFGVLLGGGARGPKIGEIAASALLFAAALCCKESAAAWLALLVGWYFVVGRADARGVRALAAGAAWLAALGGFVALRASVVGWLPRTPPWPDNPLVLYGPVTRVANAALLHGVYLKKMVWPARLSVEYGYDQLGPLPLLPWGLATSAAFVACWVAAAALLHRISATAAFLWGWVPLAFVVTGNFVFPIGTIFAERLAYLPLIGACGLAGCLLVRLRRTTPLLAGVLIVVALALALGRTARRSDDFASHATLVEATAEVSPRAVKALANLGRLRLRRGEPRRALAPLERAIQIWPDYPRALELSAEAYEQLGDPARAANYRERAAEALRLWRSGAPGPTGPPDARRGPG